MVNPKDVERFLRMAAEDKAVDRMWCYRVTACAIKILREYFDYFDLRKKGHTRDTALLSILFAAEMVKSGDIDESVFE